MRWRLLLAPVVLLFAPGCEPEAELSCADEVSPLDDDGTRRTIDWVIETKHASGPVRCALYDAPDQWLGRGYVFRDTAPVVGCAATCRFDHVPAGRYAASAYHDEDDDGDLDRNFLGIPTEDFAFSRGARAGLSAPSFEDADFEFSGEYLRLEDRM